MTTTEAAAPGAEPKPVLDGLRSTRQQALVRLFVLIPFAALVAAVPVCWGWGLSWIDIGLAVSFYIVGILGVTAGFHRYFTHGAFKAKRGLRIALAIAGQLGLQGPPITWVADHRRHHAFADREGDPHSPWLFGTGPVALIKGFYHAHMGWIFNRNKTNAERFAPDLLADKDIVRVNRWFGWITLINLALPALLGGLLSGSLWGAVTAFFWAGLIRLWLMQHVTWSTNSICHMIGERPFASRDKATNFWPLAIASMGESWHNSHHADPTCARHGVQRGQIDITARLIWIFEKLGWASKVKWPKQSHFTKLSNSPVKLGRSAA